MSTQAEDTDLHLIVLSGSDPVKALIPTVKEYRPFSHQIPYPRDCRLPFGIPIFEREEDGSFLSTISSSSELDRAQLSLEYCDIYSPIDGVVVSRSVDVGQTVAASLSAPLLFVIANDLAKMQVNASVDEADIGRISDQVDVRFTVDAYANATFSGRIAEIRLNPQTIQNVVTYSVIISVDNSGLKLKPGMTANITMTVDRRDSALKIQNAALRYLPPGMTREEEAELLKRAQGTSAESGSQPQSADDASEFAASGQGLSASSNGYRDRAASGSAAAKSAGTSRRDPKMGAASPALAPGQMWKVADKIQFPSPPRHAARPAIVWVLDAESKPEPIRVTLGITDGAFTELVSGGLKEGDRVIVADAFQESQGNGPSAGIRSPLGMGPGRSGR